MKRYRIDIILLLALFLFAFGIRAIPSDRFQNIYGFDSYWAARMTKNLVQHGYNFPINDSVADYPKGRPQSAIELGWWGLNAMTYSLFGGAATPFNYELFGRIASWMVAIIGSLTIPAVYLFGRLAYNRWVGLSAAFFLATAGNHLFYSIYGHAENDALGLALFFLCLFSFIYTVKSRDIKAGLLATFFFSWLSITWQSYNVAVLLFAGTVSLYFIISVLLSEFGCYKDSDERRETRKWMIYALLFVLPSAFVSLFFNYTAAMGIIGLSSLCFSALFCSVLEYRRTKSSLYKKTLAISAIPLLIGAVLFGTRIIDVPLNFAGIPIHLSGKAPVKDPDYITRMQGTIAEQNAVSGADFIGRLTTLANSGYGISIWFSFFAVILIIGKLFVLPFIRKDFTYEWDLFAFAFILFSMYTLTSKAITMFFLAGAVAFGAGYFVGNMVRLVEMAGKHLGKYYCPAKTAVFTILLLLFFSYIIVVLPSADSFSYDVPPEWFNTFKWINTNLPNGSVITSWWDYGHWLLYFNGDKIRVTSDNIQLPPHIYQVATSFTHTTPCKVENNNVLCDSTPEALETAEIESLSLLKPLGTTHLLVDKEIVGGSSGGKNGALQHIANVQIGCMMEFGCQRNEDNGTFCMMGRTQDGQDVGLNFSAEQWESTKQAPWPGTSISAYGISTRIIARDVAYGPYLFMSALSCGNEFFKGGASAGSPSLYAFSNRLFFKDQNLKHVKLVYDDGWNVIYEINWAGIPAPQNYTSWTKQKDILTEYDNYTGA